MNRLAKEKSPYLLQHKDNPVDWYAWGPEAFEVAKKENKIIFLSIGYSTCYWCHMMEKDSFELQEVADVLNKNFISIKVDREEHPDVDQIYMDAVVSMTGQGGWPLSLFLTPDLKPFFGGTFFWRAQFLQLLSNIESVWEREPQKLLESSAKITELLRPPSLILPLEGGGIKGEGEALLNKAYAQLNQSFDNIDSGFGGAPKFPHSRNLSLLLRIYQRTENPEALAMVTKTLDAMALGEIYDAVGGGFHRYATRADWDEPHYEKMLYDNALLALTYLEAFQVTKKESYQTIAKETLDYVLREMTDPSGGFYSAQDAGEVGKEGEYYKRTKESLEKERETRAKRTPPHKDDKILTSWNGLMIAAIAKGFQVTGDKKYLEAAQKAATFIQKNLTLDAKLLRRFREGEAKFWGTLDDYAFLIQGLITLYESDFNPAWLQWAKTLQQKQDELFLDPKDEAYFYSEAASDLIVRKKELHDGALPSANGVSALNCLRLFGFYFEKELLDKGANLLKTLAAAMEKYPAGFAQSLIALDFYLGPTKEVAIAGDLQDTAVKDFLKFVYQEFLPNQVLAAGKGDIPLLQGKKLIDNKTTFYICQNNVCKLPTTDLEEVQEILKGVSR